MLRLLALLMISLFVGPLIVPATSGATAPGTNGSIIEMECPAGGCELTNRDANGANPEAVANFSSADDYSYDAYGDVAARSVWDGTDGIDVFTPAGTRTISISGLGVDDGYMNPVLSPDGKWLAFEVGDPSSSNFSDLYLAPTDGSGSPALLVADTADDFYPAWTPDSASIVLFTQDSGFEDLISINAQDEASTLLGTTDTDGSLDVVPTNATDWINGSFHVDDISPDGKRALIQGTEYGSGYDQPYRLWEVNLNDGTIVSNSEYSASDSIILGAAYSPDSTTLAIHELDQTDASPFLGEHLVLHQLHGTTNVNVAINSTATSSYGGDVIWDTLGPQDPDVETGPPSATNLRSATLEFSDVDPGVTLECSLDGAAWQTCTSPMNYTELGDGDHTFSVRAKDVVGHYSNVTKWAWTIQNDKPAVLIDSAPSGNNNSPDETISFHGSEPDLTFTCQLDDGNAEPCGSPQGYLGLASGAHTVTIVATDSLGNTSVPTLVSFSVSTQAANVPPETAGCGSPTAATQAYSGNVYVVGRDGACLTQTTSNGLPVWSTTGAVTVNGILLTPDAGTTITLSRNTPVGSVRMNGPFTIKLGSLPAVPIPTGYTFNEDAGFLTLGSKMQLAKTIAGIEVASTPPAIQLSSANGGTAKISLSLQLPDSFSALPGGKAQIVGTYVITASNNNGVSFAGGKLSVSDLYLGVVHLKQLSVSYDGASNTWTGTAGLPLSPEPDSPTAVLSLTFAPTSPASLIGPLQAVSLVVQNIDEPLGETPIFLQKLGGGISAASGVVNGVNQSYLKVNGIVGLSLGPNLPFLHKPVVEFDGGLSWAFSDPWVIQATGTATLLTYPLANAKATITCCSNISVSLQGDVTVSVDGFGLNAGLVQPTFFQGRDQFNLAASGTLSLGGLAGEHAEAVFSNKGFAACAQLTGLFGNTSVGWGIDANGHQQVFASTCDLGAYMAAPSAAAAAPRHTEILKLEPTRGPRLLAVHGAGAAPQIVLTGPEGVSAATGPGGDASRTASALVVPAHATNTTYVLLARSPTGKYRLRSSNVGITSVGIATALPSPEVQVKLKATRGGRLRLTYSQHVAAGQTLQLLDLGVHGGGGQTLLTTTRSHGVLAFKPPLGAGRKREIVALVLNHGLPRSRSIVAHFKVADGPPEAATHLKQSHARLRWQAAHGAVTYRVVFTDANGYTRKVDTTRRTQVKIPQAVHRAAVVAMDAIGRASKPAELRLR